MNRETNNVDPNSGGRDRQAPRGAANDIFRQLFGDDDDDVVPEGGSVRVPTLLRDGQPQAARDSRFDPPTMDQLQAVEDARREYIDRICNAWRKQRRAACCRRQHAAQQDIPNAESSAAAAAAAAPAGQRRARSGVQRVSRLSAKRLEAREGSSMIDLPDAALSKLTALEQSAADARVLHVAAPNGSPRRTRSCWCCASGAPPSTRKARATPS